MTVQNADGLVETAENSLVGSEYHIFFLKKKQKTPNIKSSPEEYYCCGTDVIFKKMVERATSVRTLT